MSRNDNWLLDSSSMVKEMCGSLEFSELWTEETASFLIMQKLSFVGRNALKQMSKAHIFKNNFCQRTPIQLYYDQPRYFINCHLDFQRTKSYPKMKMKTQLSNFSILKSYYDQIINFHFSFGFQNFVK